MAEDFVLKENYWSNGTRYQFDIVEGRDISSKENSSEARVIKYEDGEVEFLVDTTYEEAVGQLSDIDELPDEAREEISEMVTDVVNNTI